VDKFVVVAGNIGAGKSTLVKLLSQRLDLVPFYEPVNENPYLADFYADMPRWAFQSQLSYLTRRLRIHKELLNVQGAVIQDRSVYEDAEIFARNLYLQGAISERDWSVYQDLYQILVDLLPLPNLIIYLRTSLSVLQARIAHRGRDYEAQIPAAYLERLNNLYEEWIESLNICPVLIISSDDLDLVNDETHMEAVAREVSRRLIGKTEFHLN
jgi:deoxyadenosine/deoxycytidine kinase